MPSAPIPSDELARLAELDRYAILSTPPEAAFDRIAKLASHFFQCPIALISLVAAEKQWFKSCVGIDAAETPRSQSFCSWAILNDEVLVVSDAAMDPRFMDNPLVTGEVGIRFYAGAPLISPRGFKLGTLCIIGSKPRPEGLSPKDKEALANLADLAMNALDARLVAREADENYRLLQTTFSSVGDGVIVTNDRSEVTFLNAVAESLTGWSAPDAAGRPVQEVFHIVNETTGCEVQNPLFRALSEGRVIGLENHTILLTKDGRKLPIDDSAAPIYRGTAVVGGILIFRDVTRRRIAERALELSERQFRSTFSKAPLGLVLTELDGRFVDANEQYRNLTGFNQEELASVYFISLTHPDEIQHNRELFDRLIRGELDSYVIEKRIYTKQRELRWVRAHASLLRDVDGHPTRVIGLVEDITDQRAAQEQLKRINRDLEEFAYVASHDLQEPLRMVNIYSQLMLREQESSKGNLELYSTFVTQGVKRMENLIKSLLDFSRTVHTVAEIPFTTADLSAAFAEASSVLTGRMEDVGAIVTADALPSTPGDTAQMTHVFQNILSNALKYRKPGVVPEIHVSARRDGDRWIVSIRDNGIGFEPEYAERIFGLFKRLHQDDYPGTGLGLPICKRIVERYGGEIWAESVEGHGATFYFSLPVLAQDRALSLQNNSPAGN